MKTEEKIIKYLAKEIVYGNQRDLLLKSLKAENIHGKNLGYAIFYHELPHFLQVILKENSYPIPKGFEQLYKKFYCLKIFNHENLCIELSNILKEAEKSDTLIIPIKGFSLPDKYYKHFGIRPSSDIDLFTTEKNFEKATFLLLAMGYKKEFLGSDEAYWRKHQCHLSFTKETNGQATLVELHWALDCNRFKQKVLPDAWNRLRLIQGPGYSFRALSAEDTILSLALHQRRFGKILNLKYICDLGIILKEENLNWEYILKAAEQEKAKASLYLLLYQMQFVLDVDLKFFLKKLKVPGWQKYLISSIVQRFTYTPVRMENLPYIYTLCQFIYYDTISYPLKYILTVPQEQFAKYYSLPQRCVTTARKYHLRIFYIPYRLIKHIFKMIF
ncbi:MAG: nucleotidyltransferase family protein [Candidatus Omnitrophica bacterium]|nr:nucleotidyltransferase family protein [Candidatus Omnitrophota bacterium]